MQHAFFASPKYRHFMRDSHDKRVYRRKPKQGYKVALIVCLIAWVIS